MRVGEFLRWVATGEQLRAEAGPKDSEDADPATRAIAREVEQRLASFTFADALALPAVTRAVDLLASQAAALSVAVYRDGARLDDQPRVVSRPTPWPEARRRDFIYETVHSLLAGRPRGGNAYWLVVDRDEREYPTTLIVADPAEMDVRWDEMRLRRRYRWRGQEIDARDVTHIRIGERAGDPYGHSPIDDCLTRLAIIGLAEQYAAGFFASGGLPEVVIKSGTQLDENESVELRNQYIGDGDRFPVRVVSGDLDLSFPAADPERSQMAQTRAYAATEVARLLGIPASLLMVETSGATITYTNPSGALTQLYRETLFPTYLNPVEAAWSDLTPGTQAVRFELNELLAADIVTRSQVQLAYLGAGVLQAEEIRSLEGWPTDRLINQSPRLEPTARPVAVRLPTYIEESAYMAELNARAQSDADLHIRDETQRIIELRIMPWDVTALTADGQEQFARGAFDDIDPARVTIESGGHGGPLVGRGMSLTSRDDAQYMTARIAPTPAGDDLLTLAREGVYQDASVAFYPVQGGHSRRGGVTVRSKVDLRRVAILERGSYPNAAVLAVRQEDENVSNLSEVPAPEPPPVPAPEPPAPDELSFRNDVRAELGAIKLLAGQRPGTAADPYLALRSVADFGEASRMAYADPEFGKLMTRALVDEITSDNPGVVPPGWVQTVGGIMPPRQPAVVAFGGRAGLPDAGMDINWPYYAGDIEALVAVQAAQKTAVNSVKISFARGTAPIATYGFAHDVAYQLILRSSPSYIASANRVLVAAFAAREDKQFVDAIVAADAAGGFVALDPLTADAAALRAALFAASILVEQATGAPATFGLAATNVFSALGGLAGLLPSPYGTSNVSGTATASTLTVNVSGLPILHDPRLPAGSLIVSNESAADYAGVGPYFVSAEDVERLGRNEAIWGMGAGVILIPAGIVWLAAAKPTSLSARGSRAKSDD